MNMPRFLYMCLWHELYSDDIETVIAMANSLQGLNFTKHKMISLVQNHYGWNDTDGQLADHFNKLQFYVRYFIRPNNGLIYGSGGV